MLKYEYNYVQVLKGCHLHSINQFHVPIKISLCLQLTCKVLSLKFPSLNICMCLPQNLYLTFNFKVLLLIGNQLLEVNGSSTNIFSYINMPLLIFQDEIFLSFLLHKIITYSIVRALIIKTKFIMPIEILSRSIYIVRIDYS